MKINFSLKSVSSNRRIMNIFRNCCQFFFIMQRKGKENNEEVKLGKQPEIGKGRKDQPPPPQINFIYKHILAQSMIFRSIQYVDVMY